MVRLPLPRGQFALVDDADADAATAHRWYLNARGHVTRSAGLRMLGERRSYYLQREIMGAAPTERVLHINGDKLDNRRANLRVVGRLVERVFTSRTAIPLTRGYVALVDEEDFDRLARWDWFAVGQRGRGAPYACRYETLGGRRRVIFMHREIMQPPDGLQVDHANRDPLDNRRCNLRVCTPRQNACNRPRRQSATGFRGVDAHQSGSGYRARILCDHAYITLGRFDAPEAAAAAYDAAAKRLHGPFATLNFPEDGEAV